MNKSLEDQNYGENSVSSYIFYGSNEEAAYLEAKEFGQKRGISGFDTIEVEPEIGEKNSKGEIKIGSVREMIRQINLTSGHGSGKMAIIRQADKLNTEAANTLLKTLEEPPKNAIIILLSSNLHLLPTIKSRCQIVRIGDKSKLEDLELFSEFNAGLGGNLKTAFARAEKLSISNNLDDQLDVIITMMRGQLIADPRKEQSDRIKLVMKAKRNLKITTNKRLILENLFMELIYGKNSN